MSLAIVRSRASVGIVAPSVSVEVHFSRGLPGFSIVGLPEKAVKESKDHVRSAILNCGFKFLAKQIIVNLALADLRKEGGRFDLPMAIGILLASEQLPKQSLDEFEIAGELELSGKLRSIKGMLPFVVATQAEGRALVLPRKNLKETALLSRLTLYSAEHLLEVVEHFQGVATINAVSSITLWTPLKKQLDLADMAGQSFVRRALEIAAGRFTQPFVIGTAGCWKNFISEPIIKYFAADAGAGSIRGRYAVFHYSSRISS